MNLVVLIGNIASDIETRTTSSGISVATFRLAVQRKFKNAQGEREADFLSIVAWRQTAELCSRYLAKGSKIAVRGNLQTRTYDAQDGSKRYVTEIVAEEVEFLSRRNGGSENGGQAHGNPERAASNAGAEDGFTDVDDDELPF